MLSSDYFSFFMTFFVAIDARSDNRFECNFFFYEEISIGS